MTTTTDPGHPLYLDEADVRVEMARVFDVCRSCRQCVDHCVSFPTLFEMLDTRAVAADQVGAGWMTPEQQDRVVDACYQCRLCAVDCPHTNSEQIDFPRLMMRATAMQREQGLRSARSAMTAELLCRPSLVGRIAVRIPAVNRLITAAPGSWRRRLLRRLVGLSSTRALPSFASRTFSSWFDQRPTVRLTDGQGRVSVVPTCLVEYHATDVGRDLVRVYERNGIECERSGVGCCGAPWLHAGDTVRFGKIAAKNVKRLAEEIRSGTEIVVAQPSCGAVIRHDYVDHVTTDDARADAELVAAHTFDVSEYLMRLHGSDHTVLDLDFDGEVADSIVYHSSSQLRLHESGYSSRDLMWLTGAHVELLRQSAGVDSVWHLRAAHDPVATARGDKLSATVRSSTVRSSTGRSSGAGVIAGDCLIANAAIAQATGEAVVHPVQVLARAYGLSDD